MPGDDMPHAVTASVAPVGATIEWSNFRRFAFRRWFGSDGVQAQVGGFVAERIQHHDARVFGHRRYRQFPIFQ